MTNIRYAKDTIATGPGTSKNLPNVDNMLTFWFADNILFGAIFFCWPYDCRQYFLLTICFAPVCCFSSNPPLVLTSAVQATDQDLKLCLNYNFFWESFRRFFFFYFSGAPVVVVSYPSTLKLKRPYNCPAVPLSYLSLWICYKTQLINKTK